MYLCACVRVHVLGVCGGGGGETVHLSVRKIGDRGLCTYVHVLGEWCGRVGKTRSCPHASWQR
jgi:hypothetical protein